MTTKQTHFPHFFPLLSLIREDFRYDQGRKNGSSLLRGASGATRKGTRQDGLWHGKAAFTASDGESREEMWDHGREC